MIGDMLREWRGFRGVSQLDLALEARVSARHVSFIESGRSRPSQEMILRLAEALGLPLRERNAMLVSAGFAPHYGDGADDEELAEVRRAIGLILASHPYPALVLDSLYDVVDANEPFRRMAAAIGLGDLPFNLAESVLLPGPLRSALRNWPEVAGYMVHRIREAQRQRGRLPALARLLDDAMKEPEVAAAVARRDPRRARAILPVEIEIAGATSRWMTTLTTFGAPQDAFVEEITIEQFHPLGG